MVDTDKIIIVGDRVLIRPHEGGKKSHGGLYLPPNVIEKEKVQSGYVLKVGPDYPIAPQSDEDEPWKDGGKSTKYIPLQASDGEQALFLKDDAIVPQYNAHRLVIVPQSAILLLVRDEELLKI